MDLSQTYFQIFGLQDQYTLDLSQVTNAYRELQKSLHPDKFVNSTPQEKLLSVQAASYINEALETLKSPLKRGIYLLQLWGHNVDLETNTAMAPEFLMTQMELREELEAIAKSEDPEDALDSFSSHLQGELKSLHDKFAAALGDREKVDFEAADELARRLTFISKLREEADKLESKLFD